MSDPDIYWYTAYILCGKVKQNVILKSDTQYRVGDKIMKRYDSGALVKIVITACYGDTFPQLIFNELARYALPPIISDI